MYDSSYDSELRNETNFGKKLLLFIVGLTIVLSVLGWLATRTVDIVDNGILHYEDFQEIYNTCQKINTDLDTLHAVPDTDPMFQQFSKSALLTAKKQQLTRWVEEYNAKSKMINRSLWKSKKLPYQLSVDDFSNYKGTK